MKKCFLYTAFFLLLQSALFSGSHACNERVCAFRKISDFPEIYECEGFLQEFECREIIKKVKPFLTRSQVVNPKSSGSITDTRRTSFGTFLSKESEGKSLQNVRKCLEKLTDIPRKNGEEVQVLHYGIGAEYKPHFDYFDKTSSGGALQLARGGQRIATLLIYLNTPEKGGETVFPKAKIWIKPIQGKAVLFYNVDLQGNPDPLSLHGGSPVISGEKWIATLWLRESEFK
jgi:prolyl 4-hydroxylase